MTSRWRLVTVLVIDSMAVTSLTCHFLGQMPSCFCSDHLKAVLCALVGKSLADLSRVLTFLTIGAEHCFSGRFPQVL